MRFFGATLFALALLVGWTPQGYAQGPGRTDAQEISQRLQPATIDKGVQPKVAERECRKGEEDRSSDLCAQWKAADAADSAARAAWYIGLLRAAIGALTLLAAGLAAKWAKKAALETQRTADLAEAASKDAVAALALAERNAAASEALVKETLSIGVARMRPYLIRQEAHVDMHEIIRGGETRRYIRWTLKLVNFGTTPAIISAVAKSARAYDEDGTHAEVSQSKRSENIIVPPREGIDIILMSLTESTSLNPNCIYNMRVEVEYSSAAKVFGPWIEESAVTGVGSGSTIHDGVKMT